MYHAMACLTVPKLSYLLNLGNGDNLWFRVKWKLLALNPLEKSKMAGDKEKSIFVKRWKGIPNYFYAYLDSGFGYKTNHEKIISCPHCPNSRWWPAKSTRPYPGYLRLFMRGFLFRLSLKKWPARYSRVYLRPKSFSSHVFSQKRPGKYH